MIDDLNQLLRIHYRSLPMYLRHAEPWSRDGSAEQIASVRDIIADHSRISDLCADWIMRRGGVIDDGDFPMEFTDTHDLSLDYLIREMIAYQQRTIEDLEACLVDLPAAPPVRGLAQESLGAARGHLQSLIEIRSTASINVG